MAFTSSEFTMLSILLQNIPDAVGSMMTLFTKHKILALTLLINQISSTVQVQSLTWLKKITIWHGWFKKKSSIDASFAVVLTQKHTPLWYICETIKQFTAAKSRQTFLLWYCHMITWEWGHMWEAGSRRFSTRWLALQKERLVNNFVSYFLLNNNK